MLKDIKAIEVLDSRGKSTLKVYFILKNKAIISFTVPSGASTGKREAKVIPVKKSIKIIKNLKKEILKIPLGNQEKFDKYLLNKDNTKNKNILGGNTILGLSGAYIKASAYFKNQELWKYIANYYKFTPKIPAPMLNFINGGAHAGWTLDVQEFMIIPLKFKSFRNKIKSAQKIWKKLKEIIVKKYGYCGVGDEGGNILNLRLKKLTKIKDKNEIALKIVNQAIKNSGYKNKVFLGLDVAGNLDKSFKEKNLKNSNFEKKLIEKYIKWVKKYNVISIEDPFYEENYKAWQVITKKLSSKIMIVGDDIFVTNPERLKFGIKTKIANALIIKPNQIGTISETISVIKLAKKSGYKTIVSHRSGDSCDSFVADLAVGVGSEFVKFGSIQRSERTEKYNRLLEIEDKIV